MHVVPHIQPPPPRSHILTKAANQVAVVLYIVVSFIPFLFVACYIVLVSSSNVHCMYRKNFARQK